MVDEPTRNDPLLVPNPKNLPSPDEAQIARIRPGSGLAVIGVFVEILRSRFKDGTLPWVYNEDIKKTSIAIESAFNEDEQHRNKRPAIYVDRDEQIIGRSVIGDMAAQNLLSGKRGFWALETVPLLIECVASKKAESAIIADTAALFLHASSDLIQAAFGFHEMSPVRRGRTQPYARDKLTQWITSITLDVQYNLRWTNTPSGPLINEIRSRATLSNFEDATQYFEHIALANYEP